MKKCPKTIEKVQQLLRDHDLEPLNDHWNQLSITFAHLSGDFDVGSDPDLEKFHESLNALVRNKIITTDDVLILLGDFFNGCSDVNDV